MPCRIASAVSRTGSQRSIIADTLAIAAPFLVIVPLVVRVNTTTKAYTTVTGAGTEAVTFAPGDTITVAADAQNPNARTFAVVQAIRETNAARLVLACKETT